MQKVTEYFGEKYVATDPGKVLRVIRDFMLLFDKALFEIKVLHIFQHCTADNTFQIARAAKQHIHYTTAQFASVLQPLKSHTALCTMQAASVE